MFGQEFDIIKEEMKQFEKYLRANLEGDQPLIKNSISTLAQAGGKRIRPVLIITTAHFGDYQREEVWPVASAVEILHMATLVHDDIIDESNLRRGEETLQSKHGKDVAVFAGDYLFSLTFDILSEVEIAGQLKKVVEIIKKICEGEIQQYQKRYQTDISCKNYLQIIKRKTALLFEGSCVLGARMGGLEEAKIQHLACFGRYMGMAFQLTDDILDFTQEEDQLGKINSNDFTQGVYTLPILYVLQEGENKEQLKNLLTAPVENKKQIRASVAKQGGINYTLQLAQKYISKAKAKLTEFSAHPYRKLLYKLADKIITREF